MREEIYFVSPHNNNMPFFINIAGVSYCDGSYHITRRRSPVFCMEYVYDGYGTVSCGGTICHPKANDIYMLPYGKDHDYYSDSQTPWKKIWFNAAGPLIDAVLNSYAMSQTVYFPNAGRKQYFEKIVEISKSGLNAEDKNFECAVLFHKLIISLYSQYLLPSSENLNDAMRMRNYIDANISRQITVDELASLIFKSRSQAIRIFKKEYGKTPYDYLLESRIKQSKILLKNTNLLIKEIAFKVGFADEHYFSDLFKRKCGTTAIQYRNEK